MSDTCLTENGPAVALPALKPCAHCGGAGQIREYPALRVIGWPRWPDSQFGVDCGNCGIETSKYGSDGPAIRDWNARAEPEDLGVIEAMLAYSSINEFVRDKEAEVEGLWKRIRQIADQTDPAWSLKLAQRFITEREGPALSCSAPQPATGGSMPPNLPNPTYPPKA